MDATTPETLRDEGRGEHPPKRREDSLDDADGSEPSRDSEHGDTRRHQSWGASLRRHAWWVVAGGLFVVVVAIAGVLWWLNSRQHEATDDAFIDARITSISAQVSGAISEVLVTDNQLVDAGMLLMRLDDRVYAAQVAQAKAQVDQAQANVANLDAQIDAQNARIEQAEKQIEQAQAAQTFAQEEYERYQKLASTAAGTVQQAQQAKSNLLQAQANLAGAEANAVATQKQINVLATQKRAADAQVEAAQAQQTLAETNLSYTRITAPLAGRMTRLTAAVGTYATPGQALSMFVPTEVWVTANFKETQLTDMHPGEPVELRIDAYPGRTFSGHVDSIQAGSGTAFSLLPAENATGNYVKVVQRVPVKITFDQPPDVHVGPGMSVVPSVKAR